MHVQIDTISCQYCKNNHIHNVKIINSTACQIWQQTTVYLHPAVRKKHPLLTIVSVGTNLSRNPAQPS